jgi:hypothetical protein
MTSGLIAQFAGSSPKEINENATVAGLLFANESLSKSSLLSGLFEGRQGKF